MPSNQTAKTNICSDSAFRSLQAHTFVDLDAEEDVSSDEDVVVIADVPGPGDWPLWRVKCTIGEEEFIVFDLLQRSQDEHQIWGEAAHEVGVVLESHTWGVNALIIPRIHYSPDLYDMPNDGQKQKRTLPLPPLQLFDAASIRLRYGAGSVQQRKAMPNQWVFRRQLFDHDLRMVDIPHTDFACTTSILAESAGLTAVQVEFYDDEEILPVSFAHLRKRFHIGDYMRVLNGKHRERCGWVQYVDDIGEPCAEVLQHHYDEERSLEVEKISVHVNLLTLTVPPMFHPQPTTSNSSLSLGMYTSPIPWKGLQVIVQKQGDSHRTMMGVVIDVLLDQNTASGLRKITDANSSSGLPLLEYMPLRYSQRAFRPPRSFDDKRLLPGRRRLCLPQPFTYKSDVPVNDGSRTPPQTETSGDSSSAWNPQPEDLEESAESLALGALPRRPHWCLNEELTNVTLRVYLDGIEEKGKDVEAICQKIDNKLCITKKKQRSRELVDTHRITAVHPGV
ncbi:hypothetical protein EDD18DRAFT_1106059 [Armillaria luteobubalina]|uniref:Uncharacterized protein n=1 Tax=Armillaria luteobubalina TaxID=153913 RepID=A0AA39UN43_9AGAR|nr:hypothetical protein EDD18DRAFT_1106059 [Armillaria luteobubalina]